ncbi:NAD-dependent epimerase/dehydratase family protein [Succinimonas sp.]|uniref:NAD-dependent epimerase/dehydratase family protein n=1 Tax=Succinimonas sp. TaxID=1936151 RepID=UPI003867F372
MNIIILGGAGFIGTNLAISLSKDKYNITQLVDKQLEYFVNIKSLNLPNMVYKCSPLSVNCDYDDLIKKQDVVYHLLSTTVPTTSNQHISEELNENVTLSAKIFEACVRQSVKKVVFISSGGTVYGKESECPLNEKTPTNPITAYGLQKITIERLLYLYNYMYGLDYRIIRLSNPYGPYQRPNGVLGAVTTFTYKALKGEDIQVYGDGSVVRDFIYIDDAVKGIQTIVNGTDRHHTFNLGCGYGTSIKQVLDTIERTLGIAVKVKYTEARKVDVPVNYLDITRYETAYGSLNPLTLEEGIKNTAKFMKTFYEI